ncbi:glycosyltransferase family 2 protein [Phycicoccus sp. HDW14]|uniref:glycosyltransferase family 2 protein n=1 Tax=Phycicoccus sp. HDW14 TaxID=2714941 RepID=UPI0014075233|nr:glycosyltransferase family 2 protein [Phycicoccus sp. HDW14]QIM21474.1 glycosyltransferase family 2 protein [Phycicoccus sp. HDW14]
MPTPSVSYLVPVLNEAGRLADAVRGALGQDYDGAQEVVVAVAPSADGTEEVAARLAREDPRVRVVDNPATDIPAGLNRALAASTGDVVVRVDAHSALPDGYTRRMVEVLLETGAANAGGIMRAEGRTPLQESVARAYNSGLGLGGGVHHAGSAAGPAETAYLGVFRRSALLAVGGYDETLRRGEDYDLNVRLRAAGYEVWFVPDVEVTYWPRSDWAPLVRQMWATGVWRGEMVRRSGRTRLRYLAAPAVVLGLGTSAAVAVSGLDRRHPLPFALAHLAPLAYAGFLGWAGATAGASDLPSRVRDAAVVATIQASWGAGFLKGVTRGAGTTVDRSRVRRR